MERDLSVAGNLRFVQSDPITDVSLPNSSRFGKLSRIPSAVSGDRGCTGRTGRGWSGRGQWVPRKIDNRVRTVDLGHFSRRKSILDISESTSTLRDRVLDI